jgi:hypothetical protein
MAQDPGEVGAQRVGAESEKSAEQLRAEIDNTREDLGDSVEALAAKTDVKSRARERAEDLKSSALHKKDELLSKVKQPSPAGDSGTDASTPAASQADGANSGGTSSPVDQLRGLAQENPVPTAAVAAFIGGVAFGRLLARR